jgi:hypothetical protein
MRSQKRRAKTHCTTQVSQINVFLGLNKTLIDEESMFNCMICGAANAEVANPIVTRVNAEADSVLRHIRARQEDMN